MIQKNIVLSLIFFFIIKFLVAQNLEGYVIPISKKVTIGLDFHSEITSWRFAEKDFPYAVSTLDVKSLMIETSEEVNKPFNLIVEEGGRRHRFILVYKNDVDLSEQEHDFSDLNNLKKIVSDQQSGSTSPTNSSSNNQNSPTNEPVNQNNNIKTQPVKNQDNINIQPANTSDNADHNFYALMDSGDIAITNHQLEVGKAKYQEALQLKPGNAHAQDALNEVNKLIANEADARYHDIIAKADAAFFTNGFDQSLQYYNDALALRPDDIYATGQVKLIQQKKNAAKIEEANRQNDSLFNIYIIAGDKYLNEKSYDAAVISYNEALKIKPDNAEVKIKINGVHQTIISDSIDVLNKRKEDAYANFVTNGDKAVKAKSYSDARFSFNEALKLKPNDVLVKSKLDSIDRQILNDSLQTVRNKDENLYNGFVKAGNEALKDSLYDEAKNDYSEALQIKPNDAFATGQIKKANDAIQQLLIQKQKYLDAQKNQEHENQYNALIAAGNNYYNSGMYAEAKDQFTQALALNNKDAYSKNKILQINSLIIKQSDKIKQDSLDNVKYTTTISKANEYFNNKDYTNAKTLYTNALKYKADDEYAKGQLSQIDIIASEIAANNQAIKDSISKVNEATKQYNALITKAKDAFNEKDYVMARGFYVSANGIKPDETEPINKIAAIDDTLQEIARQKEVQSEYDSLTTIAELALSDGDYTVAIQNFTAALKLNSSDPYYINKQIAYAQGQLKIKDAANNQAKNAEEQQKNFDSVMNIYNQAKRALIYGNYDSSLFYYQDFVDNADSANPDLTSLIRFSKGKIIAIQQYLQNLKDHPDTVVHKLPDVGKLPERVFITYHNPKNPQLEAIYNKYPDIAFNFAPGNQLFDTVDLSQENKLKSKDIMSAIPAVIVENSDNGIKLTCQNIIFKGSKVYFKFMLENSNEEEFLTGDMLLTQKTESGNIINMLPIYISAYPIILTNQKPVIIYITKYKEIADHDSLSFEVTDRLNKTKIIVTIPGKVYNNEQKLTGKQ